MATPLLEVTHLRKSYFVGRGKLRREIVALADASFTLGNGDIMGLVGESGSGKTTTARCVAGLVEPNEGHVVFAGIDVRSASRVQTKEIRRRMKMVFQNPYSSLNPRMSVGNIIGEGLVTHQLVASRAERRERVVEAMAEVGLPADAYGARARVFSGGQRQRIAIARALIVEPDLLVCDEAVSALDVSTQAEICALLERLHATRGMAILFIAHDLAIVRQVCDRVSVMSEGVIVESGDTETVFASPRHPYTRSLLAATPIPDPMRPFAAPPDLTMT
jgi:oligopeptide transport system ATP-binding protein